MPCFRMLDENAAFQSKVSNVATLTRWNKSMSVREILEPTQGHLWQAKHHDVVCKGHIVP